MHEFAFLLHQCQYFWIFKSEYIYFLEMETKTWILIILQGKVGVGCDKAQGGTEWTGMPVGMEAGPLWPLRFRAVA